MRQGWGVGREYLRSSWLLCTASFSEDTLKKEKQAAYASETSLLLDANGKIKRGRCLPCPRPIHMSFIYLSFETSLPEVWSLDQQQWQHLGACQKCILPGSRLDLLSQGLHFNKFPS